MINIAIPNIQKETRLILWQIQQLYCSLRQLNLNFNHSRAEN